MPVQQSSLTYKIARAAEIYTRYYLKRDLPVLIYCTGRVGSIAMFYALYNRNAFVFKIEDMDPDNERGKRGTVKWVYQHIAKPRRPAKVIFIVRNPVALMVSDFLPKLHWMTGDENSYQTMSPEELSATFNEKYFAEGRHTDKLTWFEREPERFLGVDVYAHPFDREAGHTRFTTDLYDVLIVRTEMDDAVKSQIVGEFVGLPDLQITRTNVGETNHYGAAYKAFKQALTIDAAHFQAIYASRYAQHFFGEAKLHEMNAQWAPTDMP
ncbi:MAG: putative capsular polysaccharide synthesis family protein [Chloroflexota bacterium]